MNVKGKRPRAFALSRTANLGFGVGTSTSPAEEQGMHPTLRRIAVHGEA